MKLRNSLAGLGLVFTLGLSMAVQAQDNSKNWPSPMHD